jgi:hypothetical protein
MYPVSAGRPYDYVLEEAYTFGKHHQIVCEEGIVPRSLSRGHPVYGTAWAWDVQVVCLLVP